MGAEMCGVDRDVCRSAAMINTPNIAKSSTTFTAAVAVPTFTHVVHKGLSWPSSLLSLIIRSKALAK